jgi:hypothetical protein
MFRDAPRAVRRAQSETKWKRAQVETEKLLSEDCNEFFSHCGCDAAKMVQR